jgi:hypothetical protein
MKKDSRLARAGVTGYNKPKRTPGHPKKSHIVVAKEGDKIKTIRFGEQGAKTAGKPKAGESEAMKKKRASFKARHAKNIAKGKMSAAFWADRVKWTIIPIGISILAFQYEELGPRPEGCSVDRINPLGDYEHGNVRWATVLEQATNRLPRNYWVK